MTPKPLKKGATYDDLVRVPDNFVAEMFDGDLYASPRPAAPHSRAAWKLAAKLDGPFDFDGPGGWIFLIEPRIDRGPKLRIYAREGITHAWLISPSRQTLEVLAADAGGLEPFEIHQGHATVRAPPFDAIELELRALWS